MNVCCRFWWSLSVATRHQDPNYCRKFIFLALHPNWDDAVRGHFDTSTENSHVYNQNSQNCETSVMMMEFVVFIMLHMFVMGGFKNHIVSTSAHLGGILLVNDVKGCNWPLLKWWWEWEAFFSMSKPRKPCWKHCNGSCSHYWVRVIFFSRPILETL